MINRRALLLGGLSVSALGLSGCVSALVGAKKSRQEISESAKSAKCSDNNANQACVKWYFNESVSVLLLKTIQASMIDNTTMQFYQSLTAQYAFIYENPLELGFAKLPINLLNKGYVKLDLPSIVGDVCANPVNLHVNDNNVAESFIYFLQKDLTKQELALLEQIGGENLWSMTYSTDKIFGNIDFQNQWVNQQGKTAMAFYSKDHQWLNQKVYRLSVKLSKPTLYGHAFGQLFDFDNDSGFSAEFYEKGENNDAKAVW